MMKITTASSSSVNPAAACSVRSVFSPCKGEDEGERSQLGCRVPARPITCLASRLVAERPRASARVRVLSSSPAVTILRPSRIPSLALRGAEKGFPSPLSPAAFQPIASHHDDWLASISSAAFDAVRAIRLEHVRVPVALVDVVGSPGVFRQTFDVPATFVVRGTRPLVGGVTSARPCRWSGSSRCRDSSDPARF